jgi:hypothetical protein
MSGRGQQPAQPTNLEKRRQQAKRGPPKGGKAGAEEEGRSRGKMRSVLLCLVSASACLPLPCPTGPVSGKHGQLI